MIATSTGTERSNPICSGGESVLTSAPPHNRRRTPRLTRKIDKIGRGTRVYAHVSEESPLLWTQGVAARETLSYLDRRGIDAEPALFGAGISRGQLSQDDIGLSVASQYRFLELAAAEANDQLLGLHVAAETDLRAIGILFYLTGSSQTVSEALENLARYSRTTNEALVVEISQQQDEVILSIRHVQESDEPHRQFFEALALWFVGTLHKETNRDFTGLRSISRRYTPQPGRGEPTVAVVVRTGMGYHARLSVSAG